MSTLKTKPLPTLPITNKKNHHHRMVEAASDAADRLAVMMIQEKPAASRHRCSIDARVHGGQETVAGTCTQLNELSITAKDGGSDAVLPSSSAALELPPDLENCRRKMCIWCYSVVDLAKFNRETVYVAMSYLDRFVLSGSEASLVCRKILSDYQLAALTSLHIAIKVHESKFFDTSLLVKLGRSYYSTAEIVDMELNILGALEWRMHPPTPMAFVRDIITLLPKAVDPRKKQYLLNVALFQTELSAFDPRLTMERPSSVAVAAILNASQDLDLLPCSIETHCQIVDNLTQMGLNDKANTVKETRNQLSISVAESTSCVSTFRCTRVVSVAHWSTKDI